MRIYDGIKLVSAKEAWIYIKVTCWLEFKIASQFLIFCGFNRFDEEDEYIYEDHNWYLVWYQTWVIEFSGDVPAFSCIDLFGEFKQENISWYSLCKEVY